MRARIVGYAARVAAAAAMLLPAALSYAQPEAVEATSEVQTVDGDAVPTQSAYDRVGGVDRSGAVDASSDQEAIRNFDVDLDVQRNGDLIVTERIEVNAAMDQIRRGIVRDFPTLYRNANGLRVQVGFDVLGVRREGADEPYALETLANGVRIRIGDGGRFLEPGRHQYEIRYRTTRQLGFFPDFDELYWNVTGNGWTFPIERASARIHLPQEARILRTSIYTGVKGERGKGARQSGEGAGFVSFETTAPLGVGEGLTVAAAWPKGIVHAPSPAQALYYQVRDNLAPATAVFGALLVLGYYVAAFLRTRRRSRASIVPLYEPPKGMSAPAVRYMVRAGLDDKAFLVAIIELIALRAMRIDRTRAETRFHLTDPGDQNQPGLQRDPLLPGMLARLFRKHKSFTRGDGGLNRLRDARALLGTTLQTRYSSFIQSNSRYVSRGIWVWLLYVAVCIATLAQQGGDVGGTIAALPFMLVGLGALTMGYAALRTPGQGCGPLLFCLLFGIPFLGGGLGVLIGNNLGTPLRALSILLPALLLPVVIRASRHLRGYTEEGHAIMDQIAGFKQYLALAEGPRLEALATVEEKLRLYERYLPYAVALDVGKKWAGAFAGLAASVAGLALAQATRDLYGGHDVLAGNPMPALRSVANDTTPPAPALASSSSSSPGSSGSWSGSSSDSSSSGSSDSGSSGGGGGGGGGSGW
ncbi:DUF2207 domain-containing protein [Bordetella genomosp. 13]|uniref:DUF2207 domain-containing protein n=1 Tax=Bordetella genomosp. 13 TaxID=463040 RepID=UPI001642406F|nr:DUF2207 domain-containing protein [Bordetella genomosp. 13]